MIEFKKLTLEDKQRIDELLKISDYQSCEYTFSNLFIWRNHYNTHFAIIEDCVVFRIEEQGEVSYSYPAGGGNKKAVIEKLIESFGKELRLVWITDETKLSLEESFTEAFEFTEHRENAEYIYNASDLIELKGKKYHAKRNHISKFNREADTNHRFEPFCSSNIEYCKKLYEEWLETKDGDYSVEKTALLECLNNYDALGLSGAMIRNNEGICAFTVGGRLNSNTFVVHIEKGLDACDGAYAVINNYFAKYACAEYLYINREDDLGIEGLRRSKLSYYPAYLINKYSARLK